MRGTYAGTFKLTVTEAGAPPCGPSTCAGCCWNNSCQPGTSKYACGNGGGACQVCGAGKTCSSAGTCVLDPGSLWRVQVFSASVMPTDGNGQPWDVSGPFVNPDPFVVVKIGGVSKSTSTKQDTLKPVWDEAVMNPPATQILNAFDLEIWDSDVLANDSIGKCQAGVTAADLFNGYKTVVSCGRADITLHFYAM